MWCSDLFNNLMIPFESLNIYRIKINASKCDSWVGKKNDYWKINVWV